MGTRRPKAAWERIRQYPREPPSTTPPRSLPWLAPDGTGAYVIFDQTAREAREEKTVKPHVQRLGVSRVLLTGLLVAAAVGSAAVARAGDKAEERVIDYYRRKANLPPEIGAKLTDIKDSKLPGAKSATIELSRGDQKHEVGILMSPDGRYVVFSGTDRQGMALGTIEDVTQDPFAAVMEKLTIKGNPAKGPQDAKVTIVEFSDFQCPYCARGHDTLSEVVKEYGDKVRVVYKNFPLAFHKWAEAAGIGGECAYDQDEKAFWVLYDYYFGHQKDLNPQNVKEKSLEALADTPVDKDKWSDCFDNKKTADRIRADMAEGQSVGVTGTPAFLINGRFLSGAQPLASFKAIIDDELRRAGGSS